MTQELEEGRWKSWGQLALSHGCLIVSAFLGHKGETHFFLNWALLQELV